MNTNATTAAETRDEHESGCPVPTEGRAYFVSVRHNVRVGILAGPYATHREALAAVRPTIELAEKADPFAAFYAFGVRATRSDAMTTAHDLELGLDRLAEDIRAIETTPREPVLWARFARHARALADMANAMAEASVPPMPRPMTTGHAYECWAGRPGGRCRAGSCACDCHALESELREVYGR